MLLLGASIAADVRFGAVLGGLLVTAVAPFHGAAHWDAAMTGMVPAFVLGLLLCTAALHAAGVFVAVTLKGHPLWMRLAAASVALAGMGCCLRAPPEGRQRAARTAARTMARTQARGLFTT